MNVSHMTWCHSKSCEGECAGLGTFKDREELESLREHVAKLKAELEDLKQRYERRNERLHSEREASARYKEALDDLARWDIEPKYLANGHDEVARKARQALLGGSDGEAK